MIGLYIQLILIISTILYFLRWHKTYRKYYEYLSANHRNEFLALIRKDKAIDTVGEWIRWPVGSAWLILSIFDMKETYGDNKIAAFKKKALKYFLLFFVMFWLALLLGILSSR